jgi:hypothetical protein
VDCQPGKLFFPIRIHRKKRILLEWVFLGKIYQKPQKGKTRAIVKMNRILYLISTFLILPLALACSQIRNNEKSKGDIISQTGTIKFIDLEGGFFGIIGDDGKNYDPLSLGPKFRVDGMRVRFRAKIQEGVVSIRMWGTPVEILEIEKLE